MVYIYDNSVYFARIMYQKSTTSNCYDDNSLFFLNEIKNEAIISQSFII